jgi:hypothetical protein
MVVIDKLETIEMFVVAIVNTCKSLCTYELSAFVPMVPILTLPIFHCFKATLEMLNLNLESTMISTSVMKDVISNILISMSVFGVLINEKY